MAEVVVRRKLSRPRVSAPFFVRKRLRGALARGLDPSCRLTLVCAGPGYGKTSTVADYVDQSSLPSTWLNLDSYDRDLEPFLTYLVKGVEANWPGYESQSLALMRAAPGSSITSPIGYLCEELADWSPGGAILVLDDFHAVEDSAAIVDATQALIEYLPDAAQLILISRNVPPLRLGQLRARRQLIELNEAELRLGHNEITAVVEALSGRRPDPSEVRQLEALTAGWAASVVLAAQSARGRNPNLVLEGGLELIFDYLAQEVFEAQDVRGQEFLLMTSLLHDVDPTVCRSALGFADASRHIELLRRRNLLLARERDDTIEFYYHPILKRFLQQRFGCTLPPDRAREARLAAGALLADSAPEDALELYLDGELWDKAIEMLTRIGRRSFLEAGRLDALVRVLDRFPATLREGSAWLTLFRGEVARLLGQFERALDFFTQAQELGRNDASARGQALALQAACLGSQGDPKLTARAEQALAVLPESDSEGLALAHNALGIAFQAQSPDRAGEHLESALTHYRRSGDIGGQIKVLNNLGLLHTRRGDFGMSLSTYAESLKLAETTGRHGMLATYANMANVEIYQGSFAKAWSTAAIGLDLAQRLGFKREEGWCYLSLSMAAKGNGDLPKATAYASEARTAAIALRDKVLEAQAMAALAEVLLQGGTPERSLELIHQAIEKRELPPDDQALADFQISEGRILLALGRPRDAATTLQAAMASLHDSGLAYRLAQVHFLLARAQNDLGEVEAAEASHARAVELCRAHDYPYLLQSAQRSTEPAASAARQLAATEIILPPDLEVRCFGVFSVLRAGELIGPKQWQGHKTKLILAHLLLHRQGVTRQQLADVLYGEELVSRAAILMLLSRLRQALEPDLGKNATSRYIQFREGRYYFNSGANCRVDTEEFEFHLREAKSQQGSAKIGRLEQALDVYTGRYLADLPGESWVLGTQEHFHLQAHRAYAEVMSHHLSSLAFETALVWADRCLVSDPCSEFAHQVKMRSLHQLGSRQDAIRHFQQMERILAKELGVDPSEESVAVYDKILSGTL